MEPGISEPRELYMQPDGAAVIDRLYQAIQERNVEAFVACFAPDYRSEQPFFPSDSISGITTLRQRWADAFRSFSSLSVELVRSIADNEQVWSEWVWTGRWSNGTPFGLRGVIIFGLHDGTIAWGRLYLLPDDLAGGDRLRLPF